MTAYQQYDDYRYDDRPRQRREPRYVVRQDPPNLLALRSFAYVVTSVASILFIALVVYGFIAMTQLRSAMSEIGGGGLPVPTAPVYSPPPPR